MFPHTLMWKSTTILWSITWMTIGPPFIIIELLYLRYTWRRINYSSMMTYLVSSTICKKTIFTPEEIKTISLLIKMKVLDQVYFSNRISSSTNQLTYTSVKCILLLEYCKMWEVFIILCSLQASLFMAASKVQYTLLPLYLNFTK